MGIGKSAFRLLLEEAKKNDFKGKKILQLGRQHNFLTFAEAVYCANQANFCYHSPTKVELSFKEELKKSNYIDDATLFSMLGFSEVHSLDISAYEQPTFIHDLNHPIPDKLYQQYDVVFDGGTLEHVFNTPQVFINIHNLLKSNGIIIHSSPSHNHVDHGFYMFSPTLFSDYYSTNLYLTITSYIFEYNFEHSNSWDIYEYKPGCLDALSFGGFGKSMLGIWFSAQKQTASTGGVIPQQTGGGRGESANQKSLASPLRDWLKKSKILRHLVLRGRKKLSQFKAKSIDLKKIRSI